MQPKSKTASRTRTIHVTGGRAHKRTINSPADLNNLPIVEHMTRSRLNNVTPEQELEWKTESVNAILGLSPRKSDQESILAFLNKRPTSEAGPSGRSVHTHEAPSPLKESPKKKRYGPNNWTPTTPPGLSPSKRNGKNAAIICWTPGNSN